MRRAVATCTESHGFELAQLLHKEAGAFPWGRMTAEDHIPWSTYPWYINTNPTTTSLRPVRRDKFQAVVLGPQETAVRVSHRSVGPTGGRSQFGVGRIVFLVGDRGALA